MASGTCMSADWGWGDWDPGDSYWESQLLEGSALYTCMPVVAGGLPSCLSREGTRMRPLVLPVFA